MAMKKSNSVRTKPAGAPPLAKTPAPKPTMGAKKPVKAMSADAARKANARGLKAANKPSTSKSADSARLKAAERARLVPPAKRTAAQKLALGRMRGGGFAGGINLNNLKK